MGSNPSPSRHMNYLDGLRGLAILLVMFFHASLFPHEMHVPVVDNLPSWFRMFLHNGVVGVDLFFVLSGFLITGILLRSRDHENYFRNFYARRILRIFPLYYLALIFWAVVFHFWYHPIITVGEPGFWPWVLTFTTNLFIAREKIFAAVPKAINHFWSLAIEEQFYFIWPAAVFLLSRRNLLRLCVAIFFMSPTLRFVFSYRGWIESYLFTFCRFDGLALGAILAILVNDPRATQWFRWATLPGFAIFLIDILGPLKSCGVWLDDTSINIFFAGLMACCLQRGFAQAVFEQRWLCWVGRRSYCAYVIHQPFLLVCLLIPWLRGQSLLWLLVLPFLCLPLTEVSWRYWEMPFLRLKRYFEPTA